MGIKRNKDDPAEVILQPIEKDADIPDVNHVDAFRALMKFYESGEVGDEEENEVDLMIQLSGMTCSSTQSDD